MSKQPIKVICPMCGHETQSTGKNAKQKFSLCLECKVFFHGLVHE